VVTGDFLRPVEVEGKAHASLPEFRPSQTENILWFYRLFRRKLAEATGLPVEMLAWNQGVDTGLIYRMLDVEMSTSGWVKAFAATEFPVDLLYFFEDLFDKALVVAFEMPESIKRLLTYLRVPFIDVNVHPIRFLPDVFFAVQTNSAGIFDLLKPYHTPSDTFYDWADLLSATAVQLPQPKIPAGGTLVIGQTNVDRSLIVDGSLRNLASYAAPLREAVGKSGPVLFKPHPYNKTSFGIFESGLPFDAIEWTRANIYSLMAHTELQKIVGISSSVLTEARYFGKEATVLAASPFSIPDTAREARPHCHFSIYDECFDVDFWRTILSAHIGTTALTGHKFRRPPNTLRTSLRNFWGFNEVSSDIAIQAYEAGKNK